MILSKQELETIAAAVMHDFNIEANGFDDREWHPLKFTDIDLLAGIYLNLDVSYMSLAPDGNICGLTAYADTVVTLEEVRFPEGTVYPGRLGRVAGKYFGSRPTDATERNETNSEYRCYHGL